MCDFFSTVRGIGMLIFLIILGVWFAASLLFVLALAFAARRPCPKFEKEKALEEPPLPETSVGASKPPVIRDRPKRIFHFSFGH